MQRHACFEELPENQPWLMGVLNVTPDSFSDGGSFETRESALRQAEKMVREGADIIDVGGESTRPGSQAVSAAEELRRVIPVIDDLRKNLGVRISIDTQKSEVAEEAIRHGATIINDVSGGSDIGMLKLAALPEITIILMHKQGEPENMQDSPHYADGVVVGVKKYLTARVRAFEEAGIKPQKIWIDPGIGFGKNVHHNLDLLRHLEEFVPLASRLVIGTSRKSFLGKISGSEEALESRLSGTIATNLWAYGKGASVLRVHDVGEVKRALRAWEAIQYGSF